MNKRYPDLRHSQMDFLRLAAHEVVRHPEIVTSSMDMVKRAHNNSLLTPGELQEYLTQVMASNFPFTGAEGGRMDDVWLRPFTPEGNVLGMIPPKDVRGVMVFQEDWKPEAETFSTEGPEIFHIPKGSVSTRNEENALLLDAYARKIGRQASLSRYIAAIRGR